MLYIGGMFKQDKKLKLNMQHTSINFKFEQQETANYSHKQNQK